MLKKLKLYLDSLRLERWPRSLAIVPGFIAAYVLHYQSIKDPDYILMIIYILIAFMVTWFISTANYIVNEITDAPYDAFHPTKKNRPLVKNTVSKKILLILWFMSVLISIIISLSFFNYYFLISLMSLLIAGILYNTPPVRIKDIPFLDSTLESANNPIRFLIGWYIIVKTFPPVFLLISWWSFGNFLMVGKRVAEKKFLTHEESTGYRLSLKRYSLKSLIFFMIANSVVFIVTFLLFALELKFYSFLFAIPFILFYLFILMKKSIKEREGAEEPEKFLKNPYFAAYTLFLVIIFIFAYIFR